MTVAGIIEQFNTENPNQVDDNLKMNWLRKVEKSIIDTILRTHEHSPEDDEDMSLKVVGSTLVIKNAGDMESHINSFNMDTDLYVPEPYDDLYIYYLAQRIAMNQHDTKAYNVATTQYNNALLTYQQFYNRTHKPLQPKKVLYRHENL